MKKFAAISLLLFAGLVNAQEILIFGGDNNKEFLGCLTCNEMAGNSIWNEMSTYGWKNGYGKWNPYGQFKNSYSNYSACNEYTTNSPVLVDRNGKFFGRLTLNSYSAGSVCGLNGNEQICRALKVMCADQ